MKKIFAALLALAMVLSLFSVSALAIGKDAAGNSAVNTGTLSSILGRKKATSSKSDFVNAGNDNENIHGIVDVGVPLSDIGSSNENIHGIVGVKVPLSDIGSANENVHGIVGVKVPLSDIGSGNENVHGNISITLPTASASNTESKDQGLRALVSASVPLSNDNGKIGLSNVGSENRNLRDNVINVQNTNLNVNVNVGVFSIMNQNGTV